MGNLMHRMFMRVMNPFYERMFLVLTIVFCSSLALVVFHVLRLQGHLVESTELGNGDLYVSVLSQLQTLYSTDIAQRVQQYDLQKIANAAVFLLVVWMGMVFARMRRNSLDLEQQLAARTNECHEAIQQLERERGKRQQVEENLRQTCTVFDQLVVERTSQLQQVNAALSKEIGERRRAEGDMQERKDKKSDLGVHSEITNKEMEIFSYSVSHDLRAPIRSINGFSQALLDDCGHQLDATARNYVLRVKEAGQRMDQVIDGMLNLARFSSASLNLRPIDLTALGQSVLEDCQRADPARQVDLAVMEKLTATADAPLLRIVLENLMGNAWKFTRKVQYPRIEFGVTYHYAKPVYYVRDNGAGFDMTYVDKLFRIFNRLHDAKEFPGTGLGLATVHRIIQRHGGRVWADAVVAGGATFFFTLEPQEGV